VPAVAPAFAGRRLEARGFEPLFRRRSSEGVRRYPASGDSRASGKAWIALDDAGCYHFCYHNSRKRSNSEHLTACFRDHTGRQPRITTKETNRKRAQRIADEYEKASRTKRTLKQAQAVLDRLHEELSGERTVRTSLRKYLADWLNGKEPETAPSTMTFYRAVLQFLGKRSDDPIAEITKQDVVAF
jgi:hypothetical protein